MEGQRVRDPELSDLVFQFFVYDSLSDVFGTCKSKGVLLSIEDNCWKLTSWLGKKETWEQTVLDKSKWNLMKTSIPIWSKNPDMFPPWNYVFTGFTKFLKTYMIVGGNWIWRLNSKLQGELHMKNQPLQLRIANLGKVI